MSTVVVFGNYGDGNVGDEAMLDVLLNTLAEQKIKRVIVPSRAPENLNKMHESSLLRPVGIFRGALYALTSDVLIVGGGTLFSHFSGKGIYPMLLVSIIRKLLSRRRTIFFGIGYSSSTPKLLRKWAKRAFNMSDGVYVRDTLSYRLLSDVVQSGKLFLGNELAFALQSGSVNLPESLREKRAGHKTLIGFSLLYTFSDDDAKMIQAVAEFVEQISKKIDAGFVFLTFNPAFIDKQGIRRSDEQVGREILGRLSGSVASRCLVLPVYPAQTTLEIVGQLDCVISMRYHCLVFAHMKKKPYIAISFEDKHTAFVDDFGGRIIDFQKLSAGALYSEWEKIYK